MRGRLRVCIVATESGKMSILEKVRDNLEKPGTSVQKACKSGNNFMFLVVSGVDTRMDARREPFSQ